MNSVLRSSNGVPTKSQEELYALICDYAVGFTTAVVKLLHTEYGNIIFRDDFLVHLAVPVMKPYFNLLAFQTQDRLDTAVNEMFDRMLAIDVGQPSHPIDLLGLMVMLSLGAINTISIQSIETCTQELLAYMYGQNLAHTLTGCNHAHAILKPDDVPFDIELRKIMSDSTVEANAKTYCVLNRNSSEPKVFTRPRG